MGVAFARLGDIPSGITICESKTEEHLPLAQYATLRTMSEVHSSPSDSEESETNEEPQEVAETVVDHLEIIRLRCPVLYEIMETFEGIKGKETDYLEQHIFIIRLAIMSTRVEAIPILLQVGCLNTLMTFLDPGHSGEVQQAAAFTVGNMAAMHSSRARLVASGIIPKLYRYIYTPDIDEVAFLLVQKAIDRLYGFFCHLYITLFKDTMPIAGREANSMIRGASRKRRLCIDNERMSEMGSSSKKCSGSIKVTYSEQYSLDSTMADNAASLNG